MTTTRATHEIQCEATRIATVLLTDAIDACDWVAVHRLAERLEELSQRGLYHRSKDRLAEISAFAMGNYNEHDLR